MAKDNEERGFTRFGRNWQIAKIEEQKEDFSDDECLKEIDAFLDWYRSKMPPVVCLVKNEARYNEICECIDTLTRLIKEECPDAIITTENCKLVPGAINFEAVCDLVIFRCPKAFASAISQAANFEVCPRTDDRLSFSAVFYGAYSAAPCFKKI